MLKTAINYEKVFARYLEEDPCYTIDLAPSNNKGVGQSEKFGHPDESDWENARKMSDFLKYFHNLTLRLSGSLQVTIESFLFEIGEIQILINGWMNSDDLLQAEMGKRMKDKYDKYWGTWHPNDVNEKVTGKGKDKGKEKENVNLLIFIGAALDPRYKLSEYTKLTIEEMFGEQSGQQVWSAITACIRELYDAYKSIYAIPVAIV